jgi:hypothetical protein
MNSYANHNSIVKTIWGRSDTVLFIFAGAAAEFAVNKAVDWLYYTGRLPNDPLGRLFSTVAYARHIIFSTTEEAHKAIDKMRDIHSSVEKSRGTAIPDEAYRDVLFMLIHYSIAAHEALERRLTKEEKQEVLDVFRRVGERMGIPDLPQTYDEWLEAYDRHNQQNLAHSSLTTDLFRQYRKHLGIVRYLVLVEVQKLLVTPRVRHLLKFKKPILIRPVLAVYKFCKNINADAIVKSLLLPPLYKQRIRALDVQPGA